MRLPIATIIVMLAAGCGSDRPSDTDPLVIYQRAGGIAGVSERLVIDPDGSGKLVVGEPDHDGQQFAIGESELERLRRGLAAADFAAIDSESGLGCADCFEYDITYADTTASFNEGAEIPDSVRAVAGELGQIVEAHLPERP
jgi:hypothetical protein